MLDRQLDRRSPNKKKRTYIIGRRYLVEKNERGNPNGFSQINQFHKNCGIGENTKNETAKTIASQVGVHFRSVENAALFTQAVDKIVSVTGIKVNDLLGEFSSALNSCLIYT